MSEQLDPQQIDEFLRQQVVGRIGAHADGETYVVPVIYVWDGDAIYVQSIDGRKIRMMRKNPQVCFEVDEYERGSWRSVIVDGTFEELHGPDAARVLELLTERFSGGAGTGRRPDGGGHEPVAFRIRPQTVSGRAVTR